MKSNSSASGVAVATAAGPLSLQSAVDYLVGFLTGAGTLLDATQPTDALSHANPHKLCDERVVGDGVGLGLTVTLEGTLKERSCQL